ncbi:MAG: KOW domain-containing RNA-binding protein [Tissierellia bacterium]|nr:KOW domain-containing RNA-binding protein [Tissierellia bacterium]
MTGTCQVRTGQVVKSKAGRDQDQFFVVLDIVDEQYLMLVDGRRRTLSHPKKKKFKHVAFTKTFVEFPEENHLFNDSYIRKQLSPFQEA